MTLATSLQGAARNLIEKFGNTGSLYAVSGITSTTSDEGGKTVSAWGTATSIKVVDGINSQEILNALAQGQVSVGSDDKIVKDNVTIAINDRLTVNSINYKVVELNPIRTQDTVVAQTIKVERVHDTTNW